MGASARGWPGIGPSLGITDHALRAGQKGVNFCEVFGGQQFVRLAGCLVGLDLKHPGQRAAGGHGAKVGDQNGSAKQGEEAKSSHDDDEGGHWMMVAPGWPSENRSSKINSRYFSW